MIKLTNKNESNASRNPSENALYGSCTESVSSYLRYASTYSDLRSQVTAVFSPSGMRGTVSTLP